MSGVEPSRSDDIGAGLVEYALLIGLMAIVSLVAIGAVGRNTSGKVSVLGETLGRGDGATSSATTSTSPAGPTTTSPAPTTTAAPTTTTTAPSTTTTTSAPRPTAPPQKCNSQGKPPGCVP